MKMVMKRVLMYISALLLISGSASAQYDVGGLVMDPSTITAFDLFNASHSQFSQMTARSAAMAGAFTSLGADVGMRRSHYGNKTYITIFIENN